jgi:hypothetical protein
VAAALLGAVAAIGGGLVLTLALVAKDTSSAVDTYVAGLEAPEGMAVYCPFEVSTADLDPEACVRYDQVREAEALRADPAVEAVGRSAATPLRVRVEGGGWTEGFGWVMYDDLSAYGRVPLVAGRAADPSVSDEAVVNEAFLTRHGVQVGDVVEVAPFTWEEFDAGSTGGEPVAPSLPIRIVGAVRTPEDLTSALEGNDALSVIDSVLLLGRGWVEAYGDEFARYQNGVMVDVAAGADPLQVLRRVAPDRVGMSIGESFVETEVASVRDAVSYEARATWAAAALAALAVAVFLGQMLTRQARRELDDVVPLRAMGATTGLLVRSSVARWGLTAAIAVAGAAALGAYGRSRGPVGVARQMLGSTPIGLDAIVAATTLAGLTLLVLGAGLGGTALAARSPRRDAPNRRRSAVPAPTVAGIAGLAWLSPASTRSRSQVMGVVLGSTVAVAAAVAAVSVVASLGRLASEPERFGASWDATISAVLSDESARPVIDGLQHLPGVDSVAGLLGNNGSIGDHDLYVYGFTPVPGLPSDIAPVVTRGRAPSAPDEIALGATSLAEIGADVGDTVELTYLERTRPLHLVGEVLVYDTWEDRPGVGAVVDHRLLEELEPRAYTTDYAVRFAPGRAVEGLDALWRQFPQQVTGPVVPGAVRNFQRVSAWPAVLAGLVALLALAALFHALLVTVRRQRGQLAVLQALGFRRRQLGATVSWFATALALPAVVVGVPLGVAFGRWGWNVLAGDLGVPSGPVVPAVAVALVAVAALLVANLAAAPLAWRAGRIDAAFALRAE